MAHADGFGRCTLERAESAEAESPPNTQLYALRSRGAAAVNHTFAPAAAHLPAAPARSPHQPTLSSGMLMDVAAAASDAMDLSESQGPIKTRLKVRSWKRLLVWLMLEPRDLSSVVCAPHFRTDEDAEARVTGRQAMKSTVAGQQL